jgi:hypothetical protein
MAPEAGIPMSRTSKIKTDVKQERNNEDGCKETGIHNHDVNKHGHKINTGIKRHGYT